MGSASSLKKRDTSVIFARSLLREMWETILLRISLGNSVRFILSRYSLHLVLKLLYWFGKDMNGKERRVDWAEWRWPCANPFQDDGISSVRSKSET